MKQGHRWFSFLKIKTARDVRRLNLGSNDKSAFIYEPGRRGRGRALVRYQGDSDVYYTLSCH